MKRIFGSMPTQQWEYHTTTLMSELEDLGYKGWELVAIKGDTLIFKRPAPSVN